MATPVNYPLQETYITMYTNSSAASAVDAAAVSPVSGQLVRVYAHRPTAATTATTCTISIAGTSTSKTFTLAAAANSTGSVEIAPNSPTTYVKAGDRVSVAFANSTGATNPATVTAVIRG